MSIHKYVGCSGAVAAGAMLAWAAPSGASMYPVARDATPYILHVDCAAGFHLGPVGTCIIGTDDPPVVVEHRDPDVGCETKTVKRTDAAGNTETKTKSNC